MNRLSLQLFWEIVFLASLKTGYPFFLLLVNFDVMFQALSQNYDLYLNTSYMKCSSLYIESPNISSLYTMKHVHYNDIVSMFSKLVFFFCVICPFWPSVVIALYIFLFIIVLSKIYSLTITFLATILPFITQVFFSWFLVVCVCLSA